MLPMRTANHRTNRLFPELDVFTRDLDRWFGEGSPGLALPVDVRQEGENLVIEAEVPGLNHDDLDITVENNVLSLTAEHKKETEDKQAQYFVRERRQGKVTRSFHLPDTADSENVAAELNNGVLSIRIPTREEAKPRKIEVK